MASLDASPTLRRWDWVRATGRRGPAAPRLCGALVLCSAAAAAQQAPSTPPATGSFGPAPPQSTPAEQPAAAPPPPGQALGPYRRPEHQGQEQAAPPPPRVAAADTGAYRHDRLYLRFGGGLGIDLSFMMASDDRFGFADRNGKRGGWLASSGATELAVGGTPYPGLVIGAGIFTVNTVKSQVATSLTRGEYEFGASQLALVAPLADYYLSERGGLHFQGGVGVASYVMGQGNATGTGGSGYEPRALPHTAIGFGIMLGAGHEWWVAEQWSVGALARMVRGWTDGTDSDGNAWKHDCIGYSVLLTLTHH